MADGDATAALVFVHGFCGDAFDTWSEFQSLVDRQPFVDAFASTDLFFYDYPCTRMTIAESAAQLNRFIEAVTSTRVVPHDSIRLIGHSTGAVVIRQLLLDLSRGASLSPSREVLLAAQPLLFSSAHFGFRQAFAVSLLAHSVSLLSAAFAIWQLVRGRVYADLDPNSPVLAQLERQTVNRVTIHGEDGLRGRLYWGAKDNVVNTVDYEVDRRIAFELDCDHRSVCKPSSTDTRPVQWVANAIR